MLDLSPKTPHYSFILVHEISRKTDSVGLVLNNSSFWLEEFDQNIPIGDYATVSVEKKNKSKVLKLIDYLQSLLRVLFSMLILKKWNVVHIQWTLLGNNPAGLETLLYKTLKKRGIKVVYTIHNVLPHNTGQKYFNQYQSIYKEVDVLICHTQDTRKQLQRDFGIESSKLKYVPLGDLNEGLAKNMQVTKNTGSKKILLYGRLTEYKGVDFLLTAMRSLLDSKPEVFADVKIVLAGRAKPDYEKEITEQIQAFRLEEIVDCKFKYHSDEDLMRMIKNADCSVFPYKHITQSAALLNALFLGAPVICSDLEGFKEAVEHEVSGLVFERDNVEDFGKCLERVLTDSKFAQQLGENAKASAEEKFSWRKISDLTLKVYEEL